MADRIRDFVVFVEGFAGSDGEAFQSKSGADCARVRLAVNKSRSWDGSQNQWGPVWFRVMACGGASCIGDVLNVRKGDRVKVKGEARQDVFKTRDGAEARELTVFAEAVKVTKRAPEARPPSEAEPAPDTGDLEF